MCPRYRLCALAGIALLPCAALADPPHGSVVAWGANESGQTSVPPPDKEYIAIAGGGNHSLGLKADGSIVAWGCGLSDFGQCDAPPGLNTGFIAVAAGRWHSVGLRQGLIPNQGSIVAWGDNSAGQITNVPADTDFIAIAAGEWHSLGLRANGSIVGWGVNVLGENDVPAPNEHFIRIAAGANFSLGLKEGPTLNQGSIVGWGDNSHDQQTDLPADTDFIAISAGWFHGMGLKADGSIVAWGCGGGPVYDNGQCDAPPGLNTGYIAIAAGANHSHGLKGDGTIVSWGNHCCGQTTVPDPNTEFFAVAAGVNHALAMFTDCNDNETRDLQDTDSCPTYPACNDCNINHVPDSCETLNCPTPAGTGTTVGFSLLGPGYSNETATEVHLVLGGPAAASAAARTGSGTTAAALATDILLDVNVSVDSLFMFDDATLRVTKPGGDGNLLVEAEGGIKSFGNLLVGETRVIDVPIGPFVLEGPAHYKKDPAATAPTTATIYPHGVELTRKTIGGVPYVPLMQLIEGMGVESTESFVNDGEVDASDEARILVTGAGFYMRPGSIYQGSVSADTADAPLSAATLEAAAISIDGAQTTPSAVAARMDLSGTMAATAVSGDFTVRGLVTLADAAQAKATLGSFVVGAGGQVKKNSASAAEATAKVEAAQIRVQRGVSTPAPLDPAKVYLRDRMEMNATTLGVSVEGEMYTRDLAMVRAPLGSFVVLAGGLYAMDTSALSNTAAIAATSAGVQALNVSIEARQVVSPFAAAARVRLAEDMTLSADADMVVAGELFLADRVAVSASSGTMTFDPGARCVRDPSAVGVASASLTASDVVINASAASPLAGGRVELTESMTMQVTNALRLVGIPPVASASGAAGHVAGTTPPPKLISLGNSSVAMDGALHLSDEIEWTNTSTAGLFLGGDLDNRCTSPSKVKTKTGTMTFRGTAPQTVEAAGIDLGATAEGFDTDVDALFDPERSENFAVGVLRVSTGTHVDLANNFANTVGPGPCQEAFYVDTLHLEAGSAITLQAANVYYRYLVDEGAAIVRVGCGDLRPVPLPPAIVWNPDPQTPTRAGRTLTMSLLAAAATGGPGSAAIRIELVDLQHPNPRNRPANVTPNFTAFDTRLNGVCSGAIPQTAGVPVPNYNGHHCDIDADCLGPIDTITTDDGTCGTLTTCSAAGEDNGCARWVGPVATFREKQGVPGLGTYRAARLQCTPYYRDWTTVGAFSIFGAEIIPSSTYKGMSFGTSCKGAESTCTDVSSPVTMFTRRAGDVAAPWDPPSTTTGEPTGGDVSGVVDKFKGASTPKNNAALIYGNVPDPNNDVGGQEISHTVDMFKGQAYPFSGPCACPSLVGCTATACTSTNSVPCGAGLCVITCQGGVNDGLPCRDYPPNAPADHCPGGTCPTDGFCRDRCGRCGP